MADPVTFADLEREFEEVQEELDEDDDKELIQACLSVCTTLHLSAEDLATKWDAFKFSRKLGDNAFTVANITALKKHVETSQKEQALKAAKALKTPSNARRRSSSGMGAHSFTKDNLDSLGRDFGAKFELPLDAGAPIDASDQALNDENASPSGKNGTKRKSGASDFKSPQPTNRSKTFMSPSMRPSPEGSRYQSRLQAGEAVVTLNGDTLEAAKDGEGNEVGGAVEVEQLNKWAAEGRVNGKRIGFRYMHDEQDGKLDAINLHMEEILEAVVDADREPRLAAAPEEDDGMGDDAEDDANTLSSVAAPSQATVLVGGRVCCDDDNAKLKTANILLEGDRNYSDGRRARLRLGALKRFALFPGQTVVAKGANSTGLAFVVDEFLPPQPLPHITLPRSRVERLNTAVRERGRPVSIMCAAGPFTASDNLDYAPLLDMLNECRRRKPDVLLLQGPFLPYKHASLAKGAATDTYDNVYISLMADIAKLTRFLPTKVLVVPSAEDAHHDSVLPTPPFPPLDAVDTKTPMEHLQFLPSPAVFRVNDISVAAFSHDVIFDLSQRELFKKGSGDEPKRMARLANHLLNQRCVYPLLPGALHANVDYSHFDKLKLTHTPDIMVLPSKLKYYAEDLGNDTIAVNPASLTKGASGGTFAMITVHALTDEQLQPDDPSNPTGHVTKHHATKRTRVDILRV